MQKKHNFSTCFVPFQIRFFFSSLAFPSNNKKKIWEDGDEKLPVLSDFFRQLLYGFMVVWFSNGVQQIQRVVSKIFLCLRSCRKTNHAIDVSKWIITKWHLHLHFRLPNTLSLSLSRPSSSKLLSVVKC